MNVLGAGRSRRLWGPDAHEFRPERWLHGGPPHPAVLLAFSYGKRACIGKDKCPFDSIQPESIAKGPVLKGSQPLSISTSYPGCTIDEVEPRNFLDISIVQSLTWKKHVKVHSMFKIVKDVLWITLLTAYYPLIASVWRYDVICWEYGTDREEVSV